MKHAEDRSLITINNLSYRYPLGSEDVLHDISFEIHEGECIVLLGENASGKTSLCKCLNGIIPQYERGYFRGEVLVDGMKSTEVSTASLAERVGIVLEDPESQLFTTKVENEVAFGPENLGIAPEEIRKRVDRCLEQVGLAGYQKRNPSELSGGEKQRLAIASALAMEPKLLILDEPSSQLDPVGSEEVFSLIEVLKKKRGMSILLASHKIDEALPFADRLMILKQGRLLAFDDPKTLIGKRTLFLESGLPLPCCIALADELKKQTGLDVGDFYSIEEAESVITGILEQGACRVR